MKNIIIILSILLTISCSLDRTNPLDPLVSGESYPEQVPNIEVSKTGNIVTISWTTMINIDGYYIYRSQSYDGLYSLIWDEEVSSASSYDDVVDQEIIYWYKMSAYIIVNEEKLEGYRSEPKHWD